MNLLLDTHAFLWFASGSERLSAGAREAITSGANKKWVSIASLWEIAIKVSLGRLHLEMPWERLVTVHLASSGFETLAIRPAHLSGIIALPHHHSDPFDRLLASQCLSEGLSLVSTDTLFDKYGVERVW